MHIIRVVIVTVALSQVLHILPAQGRDLQSVARTSNVPRWALEAFDAQFRAQYAWYDRVNPFYQRGDFDGDGQADVALLIRHRATGKIGIAFVHRATRAVHIVGAGTPFGSGGDDFSWLGVWRVEDGRVLVELPRFRGEVLYVETPEAAGALIYWDGAKYQWVQRGE